MLWWSDELKIGIEAIDEQHKGIFDRVDYILNLEAHADHTAVKDVFEFLLQYVITHFKEEEAVMVKNQYPNYLQHKEQHAYFVNELHKLVDQVKHHGINEENIDALKLLVIEWLVSHISENDRQFAIFYSNL